ncbi:MAG: arylamine N-acetyltransferase [Oscillospiraceae bacterium]|nr:arylamine N-acetyltransferase [Oscillospiraceae bacterium]
MFEELYAPLPDAGAYLRRIGLDTAPERDYAGLCALVRAHQQSVPFENYELCAEDGHIDIGIEHLFDKVVLRRRGGYCFELNGLFCALLAALGFDVYPVLARIYGNIDHPAPLHRGTIITIDGKRYFADVGFGGPMPAGAILMEDGAVTEAPNGVYRFDSRPEHQWLLSRLEDGRWLDMLGFSGHPADPTDFIAPNFYCSDSPASFFRMARLANIYTPDGFYSLMNDELKLVSAAGTETRKVAPEEERQVLRQYFGIELS